MKVLVTGADGFIGSHLAETLVRAGHQVRAMVLYNSFGSWGWLDHSPPEVRDAIEVVSGDVRDPACTMDAVRGCDTVMHLAALIAIPWSYQAPASYVDTNVTGTLNMLQAARAHGVERFIHTSTSEVYGTARFVPITEEHPLQPQSPYSATKIAADSLALSFHASFDLPVVVARPFNTYGPRQSARAVIPTIITQLASGARRLELGATSPTRDFNYVQDTVDAFLAIARAPAGRVVGEVINLGSNYEVSIGETVELIADLMGMEPEIICDERRLRPDRSEVERLWADNSRALERLDWRPAHAGRDGFRRGLEQTIDWFRDPANLAAYKADRYNV